MIVLGIPQETGGAVYFDIHHLQVSRQEEDPLYVASGTLGDGWYEGEISVTLGEELEVTFADEWLDQSSMREFFTRVGREEVCAALAETLGTVQFYVALSEGPQLTNPPKMPEMVIRESSTSAGTYRRREGNPSTVFSAEPCWVAVA